VPDVTRLEVSTPSRGYLICVVVHDTRNPVWMVVSTDKSYAQELGQGLPKHQHDLDRQPVHDLGKSSGNGWNHSLSSSRGVPIALTRASTQISLELNQSSGSP
jgi:hypothetical protein